MEKGNVKKTVPLDGNFADIAPEKFKKKTRSLFVLRRKQKKDFIKFYRIRNESIGTTTNGAFQFKGSIKYSVIEVDHCILFECKCLKDPVKRKQIWELKERMKKRRARKGVFVTTSYYQFGAIKYAEEYGILLLSVLSEEMQYQIRKKELEELNDNYYSSHFVIRIEPYRAARVQLKNDREAFASFFNPGDFYDFLFEYNSRKKDFLKKHRS